MNRRVVLGIAVILCGVSIGLLYLRRPVDRPAAESAISATPRMSTASPRVEGTPAYDQISLKQFTRDQAATEVTRRDRADSKWEWKIPIKFYGLVLNENEQPVSGVNVHFQWTNLSTRGTGEADTQTDSEGRFVLEGVSGKRLLVRLSKPGYDPSDARNKMSFEYAIPSDEMYHEPYADAPITFHLRTRKPSADVVSKSTKVMLQGEAATVTVGLDTGKPSTNGELIISASKPWPPRPMSPSYNWKVGFRIENGGFVDAPEQFGFEAPDSGYLPDYTVDMQASLGSDWKVNVERTVYFVFGTPRKYGHLTFRTDGNSRYIFLDYVVNLAGSRNLEPPNKTR
jgi:hypothetical protein